MDSFDEKIIKLLQKNARMTSTALAKEVCLSRTAVQERIAKLERKRVISGYTLRLGADHHAQQMTAVLVVNTSLRPCSQVLQKLSGMDGVERWFIVNGDVDAFVFVQYSAPEQLQSRIDAIAAVKGIKTVRSYTVMSQHGSFEQLTG